MIPKSASTKTSRARTCIQQISYFEDGALLDLLVTGKLGHAADALREAESWKWTEAHLDFPHAHGLRQTFWLLG